MEDTAGQKCFAGFRFYSLGGYDHANVLNPC